MGFTTLITPQQLRDHVFDTDWAVLDCRHDLMDHAAGRRAYEAGHIPGAQFAAIETDLAGEHTGRNGRHPLPERAALARQWGLWGIDNNTQIVAYDAQGGQFAVRLWWLARWLGHDKVAVLDGGWPAWLAATQWSSIEAGERAMRNFIARESLARVVDAGAVLARSHDALLVDARAPERYRGEVEPIDPVAGHIPGAVNRFWQQNLGDTAAGIFKSADVLRQEFDALLAGRSPDQLIAHCGSGVTACHHLLAMEHAGLHGAALYAGSWSEWIADASRPVATGSPDRS
jgi:thiosulfate/3-mercaptopyruvate sulfurtransferase